MKCERCYQLGALLPVQLGCGCVRSFCTGCISQDTARGEYLSFRDWCDSYALSHLTTGGSWVGGHQGRPIELRFEDGTRQCFFLWSYELRQPCGIAPAAPRLFVRPALYQDLAMLLSCPLNSSWQQRQEFRRRQFRQQAQRWLQRAA